MLARRMSLETIRLIDSVEWRHHGSKHETMRIYRTLLNFYTTFCYTSSSYIISGNTLLSLKLCPFSYLSLSYQCLSLWSKTIFSIIHHIQNVTTCCIVWPDRSFIHFIKFEFLPNSGANRYLPYYENLIKQLVHTSRK